MQLSTLKFSGDVRLSPLKRLLWDCINYCESQISKKNTSLDIYNFNVNNFDFSHSFLSPHMSPSRLLCNLFTMSIASNSLMSDFDEIRILDCACGGGNYLELFNEIFDKKLKSYYGFDYAENPDWTKIRSAHPNLHTIFTVADAHTIQNSLISDANFIFSQSAIEHFKNDFLFFKQIANSLANRTDKIIQVHLLPGPNAWRKTGPHGYRGYTLSHIDKIKAVFPNWDFCIVKLGNKQFNRVHFQFVHDEIKKFLCPGKLLDIRHDQNGDYRNAIKTAMSSISQQAPTTNSISDATFIVIILTNKKFQENIQFEN